MEKIIQVSSICPEGYELDKEKSTIENLVFKPRKESCKDIYKKLFYRKKVYYSDEYGDVISSKLDSETRSKDLNNCASEKQAKKLLAINQLMNVAKYLNGDWQPNWDNENEKKYTIFIDGQYENILIDCQFVVNKYVVYFKTKELAQRAIEILGEETIKLALSTDW